MKKFQFFVLGIALWAVCVLGNGCTDPCKDQVCNQGVCSDGECICDSGYEGVVCSVKYNSKFQGVYNIAETCDSTGSDAYTVHLDTSSVDPAKSNFTGLYRVAQGTVLASINSDGVTFSIAPANVGSGTIESIGVGTANSEGSTINLVYKYISTATGWNEQCTALMTRQ